MAQKRPRFFLADLVAIIALSGLGLALVRSFGQPGNPVGIFLLIGLVAFAWSMFSVVRRQPTCEECGRRFVPPRNEPSLPLCPRCGQPQLGLDRSRNALAIGSWALLALVVITVVLMRFPTMDLVGSPAPSISWIALHLIAVPLLLMLLLGLFIVLLAARFWVSSARRKPVPCEKCGTLVPPAGTTGPLICPRCRLGHLPKEQLRKERAKGGRAILALLLMLVILAGFMLPDSVSSHLGVSYWVALPLVVVAALVGLPAVFFVAAVLVVVLVYVVRARRFKSEPYILARARKASGEDGEVVRSDAATVWYSGPTNPVPHLMEQMEATRSRFESLLGREVRNLPPLRILCFRKRSAFQAFLMPFTAHVLNWLKTLDGIYYRQPHCILTLCTDELPFRVFDPDETARILFGSYFFIEICPGNPPPAWLQRGISRTLTSDDDDRARLNRKMLVSLSRGTALGTDLFKLNDKDLLKQIKGWADHRNFERSVQSGAESCSMVEYLGGGQAPEERRDRFRAFLNDNQSKAEPEEVFQRHFGFGFDRLVESWREWVHERGIGSFMPPPMHIRDDLLNRVIPLVEDRQAKREDRILAIRNMGTEGYVLGADALIGLLQGDAAIPREEVVWALEAISGMAYADDPDRWAAWWSGLPTEIREGRRRHEEEGGKASVARQRSSSTSALGQGIPP